MIICFLRTVKNMVRLHGCVSGWPRSTGGKGQSLSVPAKNVKVYKTSLHESFHGDRSSFRFHKFPKIDKRYILMFIIIF